MRKTKFLHSVLLLVLIAAMALSITACKKDEAETPAGESKTFTLEVTPFEGETKTFTLTSTQEMVGDALLDEGLIAGEESEYGLYILTVDGVSYDYDTDGHYWAFYIDGEYAMTGVDSTPITEGTVYALRGE